MKIKESGFVMLPSYYEAIKNFDDKTRLELYDTLIGYGMTGELNESDNPIVKALMVAFKPNIDNSIKRYNASVENGKKGGRPRTKSKPNNNLTETQSKPKPNLNVDVDVDVDVDVEKKVDVDVEKKVDVETDTLPTMTITNNKDYNKVKTEVEQKNNIPKDCDEVSNLLENGLKTFGNN